MLELLQMWALMEVLGIIFLPLTVTVFHNLPDRGWAFSKALGLAVLAFCVWLPLMCLQFLPFSQIFILGVFLILIALNILFFMHVRKTVLTLFRSHIFYIVCVELIFFSMVFLLGWVRSYGPDIRSFEMFMDEGFLAAIMRSAHFPPNDMWYAGQSINYYYYAHYNIALMAKLLGQSPSVAFNTGICTFFGLTAVNLFGVTSNVVAWAQHRRRERIVGHSRTENMRPDRIFPAMSRAIPYGILSILLGLVLGNLAATQTWWQNHGDLPDFYWFNASRVVANTINEFPAFSFLLSCFHAHVLALAFTILSVALALNLLLKFDGQGLAAFGHGWRLPVTLVTTALVLGSLFAMNGWDYPTYLALTLVCLAFQQWHAHHGRLSWDLALDVFTAGAALGALSFFLFAPFYLNFVSPALGIGLVGPDYRSPLANEVLIYGVFAFIFISFLLANFFRRRLTTQTVSVEQNGTSLAPLEPRFTSSSRVSLVRQTVSLSATQTVQKELGQIPAALLLNEGEPKASMEDLVFEPKQGEEGETLTTSGLAWCDLRVMGSLATLLVGLLLLLVLKNSLTFVVTGGLAAIGSILVLYHLKERERAFILLLGAAACALVAFCEVVFLRDVFAGTVDLRMNTVFKFYFQAWALLSIVGGASVYFVLESLRPTLKLRLDARRFYTVSRVLWSVALLVFLLMGAVYPLTAPYQRYNKFVQHDYSMDGLNYMSTYAPGDYQAIRWLNNHVQGDPGIVEAVGPDYSDYGRISIFTGLPSPMGWIGHELQWRVNWMNRGDYSADFYRRADDVKRIYTDPSQQDVLTLMSYYHAQYLYVGSLEQATYFGANLERFSSFMRIVYQYNGVTIYQIR
jgi:YYY domain-containing protein